MCNKLPELYNPSDDDILIVSTDACVTHWGATVTVLYGKKSETTEKIKKLITQKTSLKQKKVVKIIAVFSLILNKNTRYMN